MPISFSLSVLALAVASGSGSSAIELRIDLTALAAMPARQLQGMVRETTEIWKSHGVALTWVTSPVERDVPLGRHLLRITDGPRSPEHAGKRRLGSILFPEGSLISEGSLTLSVESIGRLVEEAPLAGHRVGDWPEAVRFDLVGRALGRVLAHEIGHYLLAWRTHTDVGLMRQSFRSDLLIDPDRRAFALPRMLLPRLRARLAQLAEPDASLAGTR